MSNKYSYGESIGNLIIAMLSSHRSSYRFHKILNELESERYKEKSVRVTLSRLHKKGYLSNSKNEWSLTKEGKLYSGSMLLFAYIPSPFDKSSPTNTILSFDIPEKNRHKRNWLRNQLKIFNYKMLQQSLWIGHGPLPKIFLDRLNNLEIRNNIKIFSINKKRE